MPRIAKCDCGENFDLDKAIPCESCKSCYCDKCCKSGEECQNCKMPEDKQIQEEPTKEMKELSEKMYSLFKEYGISHEAAYVLEQTAVLALRDVMGNQVVKGLKGELKKLESGLYISLPEEVAKDVIKRIKQLLKTEREATEQRCVKEIVEILEKIIQEERYSGAPYALNKAIKTLTNKRK